MGQLYLHGPADWFYFRGGWYSYICMAYRGGYILKVFLVQLYLHMADKMLFDDLWYLETL